MSQLTYTFPFRMGFGRLLLCFCCLIGLVYSDSDYFRNLTLDETEVPDICIPGPKGRVDWILHKRQRDYGWKEHTHRANIALAVNAWVGSKTEMRQMELQLEVEITKALLRNYTEKIHGNDLALFIHSLIATSKNPRNFHGIDLVEDLLDRVNNARDTVHPFLVLALCNSQAVELDHLKYIRNLTHHRRVETRRQTELKALALKAFACAATLRPGLDKFGLEMKSAAECLTNKQNQDGSFGNAYTTALAVQALTAHDAGKSWEERKALEYLHQQAYIKVNMIKAYYIELALNARNVTFIKDLYNGPPMEPESQGEATHYVQYTVKSGETPDIYHTITMKVPRGLNFYKVMEMCSKESENFRFSYYINKEGNPAVYSVAGIPNDAEEGMFWRLCIQKDVNHNRHTSIIKSYKLSPNQMIPEDGNHIIFWYRNKDCESTP